MPIIIKKLGPVGYGQWVFLLAVTNYFMLAQFGVSVSFKKYISEDLALKNYNCVKEFYTTAFYTLIVVSIALVTLTTLLSPIIFRFFDLGGTVRSNSNSLIFLVAVSCISLINEIAVSIPQCYQRFDIASYITISGRVIYLFLILFYFWYNPTINIMIVSILISSCVILMLNIYFGFRLFPQLSFSIRDIKKVQFIRMFRFGVKIQIAFIANYIANNLDKVLIGKFLGPAYITIYDIGTKIITFLREIPFVFFLIIMPYSSELFAIKDIEKIKQISLDFTRYFLVFASVVFSFVYFTGESVLRFWIGDSINPISVYVLHVLLIGAIIHLSTGIMTSILKSVGKMRPEIIGNTVILIVNSILSVTLITFFGLKGVVWGTSLGFITGSIVLFYLSTKALNISFPNFMLEIFKVPLLNALIVIFVNYTISKIVIGFINSSDMQILINISIAFISMLLNVLILYKLGYLPLLLKKKIV